MILNVQSFARNSILNLRKGTLILFMMIEMKDLEKNFLMQIWLEFHCRLFAEIHLKKIGDKHFEKSK